MSKGALLNYTTEIAVEKTIREIYSILAQNKTSAIMSEYDGAGNIVDAADYLNRASTAHANSGHG